MARPAPQGAALPSWPPVADVFPPEKVGQPDKTWLTAQELVSTRIEIKNGTGVPRQARKARERLGREGFTVTNIGNHVNFGLQETFISARPGRERVAEALRQKFFPGAQIRSTEKLPPSVDLRVSLGQDQLQREDTFAKLAD